MLQHLSSFERHLFYIRILGPISWKRPYSHTFVFPCKAQSQKCKKVKNTGTKLQDSKLKKKQHSFREIQPFGTKILIRYCVRPTSHAQSQLLIREHAKFFARIRFSLSVCICFPKFCFYSVAACDAITENTKF